MTARLLLVVEDTFEIRDRGLIVAPDVDLGPVVSHDVVVELRLPDGSSSRVDARAEVPMFNPPRATRHVLRFPRLTKEAVPKGTEVWTSDDEA